MPKISDDGDDIYAAKRPNQVASIVYGLVMVVAIIVAGAALLGGSMGQIGQRWSSSVDGFARVTGLSLQNVELIGLEHAPDVARQVRLAVMIEPGENMFRADPYDIKRRIEATELVNKVSVYRLWPDTVMIYATAVEPVALWRQDSGFAVVDSLGRIVQHPTTIDEASLLQVSGEDAAGGLPDLIVALTAYPDIRPQIDHLERVSARRWDMILKSGLKIQLPNDENIHAALARLARLEAKWSLSHRRVAQIDLRLAQAVYIKPSSATDIEEAA